MTIFLSGIILLIFLINLNGLGFFILNKKNDNNEHISVNVLFGVSTLILYSHFSFYLLELKPSEISISFFIISLIFVFLSFIFRDGFAKQSKDLFLVSIPIVTFFLLLAFLYGEQFYVFRGNKWDWFAFVTSSFYLNNLETLDFLELKNNFSWDHFKNYEPNQYSAYHNNIASFFFKKINILLLGSFFLDLKFNSPFFNLYLIKIFSLILINISIMDFIRKYSSNKNDLLIYFISLIFVSSFWTIYLMEADYYRQLISFGFFIYLITNLDEFFIDFEKNKYKKILISTFFIYSLFLIYTELLFIYLVILFIFFIQYKKKIFLIKNRYFYLLVIFIGLFIIILPSYELILSQIKRQIGFSTSGENRWWTYFGAFIFGRSSPALDVEFANVIKSLIYNTKNISQGADNVSLKDIYIMITDTINKFNYQSSYLSIIPSISGFYFITDLFKFDNTDKFNIIFLILLNIYLIYIVFNNLYFILKFNNNLTNNIKIFLSFFIIFSFYFIAKGKLWTFIKFYMYMSPFIFVLIMFSFSQMNKKLIINPNLILLIIMSTFVFYKFHKNNSGIGNYDSFPSIQKLQMKKNIKWNFENNKYLDCKKVILKFNKWDYYNNQTISDRFQSIYISIHLLDNNFKFEDNFVLINTSLDKSDKICEISNL